MTVYGIFTKPIHIEKIVNYLNKHTNIDYIVSTEKPEIGAYEYGVGIGYCFPRIIPTKNFNFAWYNYHPAPLPEYPGLTNYAKPIRDRVTKFGVSLHLMTDEIDAGPLLCVKRFDLLSPPVNTNELGSIAHYYLFQLFKETIEYLRFQPKNEKEMRRLMQR